MVWCSVENFRPGVMDRLGIGYDTLSAQNPGLIYASVSGFGQHGPHASRPAFDSLLQAAGGLISVTGPAAATESDGEAAGGGGPPVRVGVSIVDICSGLHALIAVLAALHHRTLRHTHRPATGVCSCDGVRPRPLICTPHSLQAPPFFAHFSSALTDGVCAGGG